MLLEKVAEGMGLTSNLLQSKSLFLLIARTLDGMARPDLLYDLRRGPTDPT